MFHPSLTPQKNYNTMFANRIHSFRTLWIFMQLVAIQDRAIVALHLSRILKIIRNGGTRLAHTASRMLLLIMTFLEAPSMNQFLPQVFSINSTAEASFILLGMTAEKLLPISAVELVCAYPHAFGSFPSAIKFVIGQHVEFEVQLPKFSHSNHFGEFKICNISGLAIPHAEIIDNLPAPIAPKP
ncbi:hypothetical protein LINPERPRIM_LOCUS14870 [Linum perenne]